MPEISVCNGKKHGVRQLWHTTLDLLFITPVKMFSTGHVGHIAVEFPCQNCLQLVSGVALQLCLLLLVLGFLAMNSFSSYMAHHHH